MSVPRVRKSGWRRCRCESSELSRAQRAKLNKAAAGQNALAERYEKIERGMDELAQQLADDQGEVADTLSDALSLARRLAIGGKMQETARDLAENRVGGALGRETQIAEDIQQVVAILRNTNEQRPEQLADKLRDAEQRLAELRAAACRASPANRSSGKAARYNRRATRAAQRAAAATAARDRTICPRA